LRVLNAAFDHPQPQEEKAAMPLAGGIMQYGYQCGMIWGAALAAGAEAYRRFGAGPVGEAAAVFAARRIVDSFRDHKAHIDCFEITQIDRNSSTWQQVSYFLLKGGTIGCFRMAAQYAKIAYREIESALAKAPDNAPSPPLSCASIVARKLDASEIHTVMAAGLAGGIGLCGGACGALGAALWLKGLRCLEDGAEKLDFKAPYAKETVERFLACSDYKFQCSEIVGREFESIGDHAEYVRANGCAEVIDTLATVE